MKYQTMRKYISLKEIKWIYANKNFKNKHPYILKKYLKNDKQLINKIILKF